MSRIIALVDEETGLGFRLAGIAHRVTDTSDAMKQSLESFERDANIQVVILDEMLFRQLPDPFQKRIEESTTPIFVPIPTMRLWKRESKPEEYIARLLHRAIGYQIKIRR